MSVFADGCGGGGVGGGCIKDARARIRAIAQLKSIKCLIPGTFAKTFEYNLENSRRIVSPFGCRRQDLPLLIMKWNFDVGLLLSKVQWIFKKKEPL